MSPEQYRGTIESYSTNMVAEICVSCGVPFLIPVNFRNILLESHRRFFCPNGHGQSYCGETEAEKLKKQLQNKESQIAQLATSKVQLENQLNKANAKLTKVAEGKCPCCGKLYKHLANHMKNKHPHGK